jgi:hypothetical protein
VGAAGVSTHTALFKPELNVALIFVPSLQPLPVPGPAPLSDSLASDACEDKDSSFSNFFFKPIYSASIDHHGGEGS